MTSLETMARQQGLTLATLCDMVLGEDAPDRSDAALIRGVRQRITALEEALNELYHRTDCTTWQMEIIHRVCPQK